MLVEAFSKVSRVFPEYRLHIIGSTNNKDDEDALEKTKAMIEKLGVGDFVEFMPFSKNVHNEIVEDALYVNSSDHEGMSNAMLEAMAIGMPVVCTDCPIGGAKAVIKNGENGMLAKVGDADDFADAIIRVLSDKRLAESLSLNGAKIRDELSIENISKKWMELF